MGDDHHWEDDSTVKDCQHCNKPFSTFRRKHHCRSCGKIFCHPCSSGKIAIPYRGFPSPVRACVVCMEVRKLLDGLPGLATTREKLLTSKRLCELSESPIVCFTIAQANGGSVVVPSLLADADVQCQAHGALLLARMSQHESYRTVIGLQPGVLTMLVKLASRSNPAAQYNAACALANLAIDGPCSKEIGHLGGLETLLNNLKQSMDASQLKQDTQLQHASLSALATLAADAGNRTLLCQTGVGIVTEVFRSSLKAAEQESSYGFATVSATACAVLTTLCQSKEALDEVQKAGGVELLCAVLADSTCDMRVRRAAINGLGNLTFCENARIEMCETRDALRAIKEAITSADAYVVIQALAAAAVLAGDDSVRPALLITGILPAALHLLTGGTSDEGGEDRDHASGVRVAATMALTVLVADDESKEKVVNSEALLTILDIATSPTDGVAVHAVALLASLAECEQCHSRMARADCLQALFALLTRETVYLQALAVRCLGFLALSLTNAARMAEFGASAPLLDVLEKDHFLLQFYTAWTLANIYINAIGSRKSLTDVGVLPRLLSVARSWHTRVQKGSGPEFARLQQEGDAPSGCSVFPRMSVFNVLVESDLKELQSFVAWSIAMLSYTGTYQLQICQEQLTNIAKLATVDSLDVQMGVATTLLNLAQAAPSVRDQVRGDSQAMRACDALTNSKFSSVSEVARRAKKTLR